MERRMFYLYIHTFPFYVVFVLYLRQDILPYLTSVLVFCVYVFALFCLSTFYVLCPMLSVSLDCPFWIASWIFSKAYFHIIANKHTEKCVFF